jgi:hypothetical protein
MRCEGTPQKEEGWLQAVVVTGELRTIRPFLTDGGELRRHGYTIRNLQMHAAAA